MRVEESGIGLTVEEKLTAGEAADEYLVMGLRLAEGIDPARYSALSGRTLDPKRISILREEGAVETTTDGRLRVTQSGFPLLDAVVADLAA
jgi:oxygen-independent coproporphyrinogen-3 oxidase